MSQATITWRAIAEQPPAHAGRYLVASDATKEVAEARYMPKKGIWKFPSASRAFNVTHWADKPAAP